MHIADSLKATQLPRSEAEVLLAAVLGKERSWLLAHPEYVLTQEEEKQWKETMERKQSGEPAAYIIGKKEFYGRPFTVDRRVLIPRPATEGLVDAALAWLREPTDAIVPTDAGIVAFAKILRTGIQPTTIVDVGTGSGAIAVTLALERPDLRIIATDISADALDVAKGNATRHGVSDRMSFRLGSLIDPVVDLREPFLLVSNPPYVPAGRELPKGIIDFEPANALFAGEKGLDVLQPLLIQAKEHLFCCGFVVECEKEQATIIQQLLTS